MYTVKTLNKIAKIGLDRLDKQYFALDDGAADPAAILVRSAKRLDYEPNPALLCVARAGAGYNNIPVDAYAENRTLLTSMLDALGYTYIQPDGAFYLWVKALEDDSQAFCDKARDHDLLLVNSDCFGVPGWARAGYCVSAETIANSRKAWAALKEDYE